MSQSSAARFPVALPPPSEPVTLMSRDGLAAAIAASRQSPRRRIIQPLHKVHSALLQRMFNVVQPGSYLRPHRHATPPKAENLLIWQGAIVFLEFDDEGRMRNVVTLRAGGPIFGVDIEPGVFHTFLAIEPDTVVWETKSGPYEPINDKDFAPWAPPEGTPEAAAYLEHLHALAMPCLNPAGPC